MDAHKNAVSIWGPLNCVKGENGFQGMWTPPCRIQGCGRALLAHHARAPPTDALLRGQCLPGPELSSALMHGAVPLSRAFKVHLLLLLFSSLAPVPFWHCLCFVYCPCQRLRECRTCRKPPAWLAQGCVPTPKIAWRRKCPLNPCRMGTSRPAVRWQGAL